MTDSLLLGEINTANARAAYISGTDSWISGNTALQTDTNWISGNTTLKDTTNVLKVYPYKATGVAVDAGESWAEGSWNEVVPTGSISSDFIIVGVYWNKPQVGGVNNDEYILDVGTGAAASEVTKISLASEQWDGQLISTYFPLPVPFYVSGNSRVAARSSHSSATAETSAAQVKIYYYELPLST